MKHRICFKENKHTQEKHNIKRTFKQQTIKHNFYIKITNKESNTIKPKKNKQTLNMRNTTQTNKQQQQN